MEKELQKLADHLNLTSPDSEQEPYILTEEEEKAAIEWELQQAKNYVKWKMKALLYGEAQIAERMSEINWDERIDRETILQRANSNKQYDLWQNSQREKEKSDEKERLEDLKKKYSARTMFNLMQWTSENEFGKKLIMNDDNKKFITALCFFFSNDGRFETELGFSFRKGLLIRGVSGLGKTHLMKCISKNELNPILILSMLEITDEIKSEGEYEIRMNGNKSIYLDDVGTEELVVNHFGTKISFFKNFIENYYLRNRIYNKLIISTNNNFSEIENKYGFRVRSRMKDMFNIINVSGQDMRG